MNKVIFSFLFLSTSAMTGEINSIPVPLDIFKINVQRVDGTYHRYIQYMSNQCLMMDFFVAKNKNHKLIDYSVDKPNSYQLFCGFDGVNNRDLVDYSYEDFIFKNDYFGFTFKYKKTNSPDFFIKKCTASLNDNVIDHVSCK